MRGWVIWMMHIPTVKTKHETSIYFIYSDARCCYIPMRAAATKIKFLQNLLNLKQNGHAIFLFKFLRESKEER